MSANKKEVTSNDLKNIAMTMPKTFLSLDGRKILYQPSMLTDQMMQQERESINPGTLQNCTKMIVDRAYP